MADLGINSIIILITLFIIFGVFLLFDLFKRNENYGYLAYIVAVVPINYIWYLTADNRIGNLDVLSVYMVLFILWIICLLRDIYGVYNKNKDYDDVLLFLALGILVQLIVSAILPADQVSPALQKNTEKFWYFYLPDVYTASFEIEAWVNSTTLTGFRIAATIMIFLAITPLILDIKDEPMPFLALIIITAIFVGPFLYLSYIWVPGSMAVLTGLFSVILFIILLLITRSGRE
ncbi:MAG: hypothetical protein EU548_04960 [Promethearchaeota archaeon]|nr:MAG: hypothetical protein EU548_04960 [Candidatus Lokiarchaeota archaeon]